MLYEFDTIIKSLATFRAALHDPQHDVLWWQMLPFVHCHPIGQVSMPDDASIVENGERLTTLRTLVNSSKSTLRPWCAGPRAGPLAAAPAASAMKSLANSMAGLLSGASARHSAGRQEHPRVGQSTHPGPTVRLAHQHIHSHLVDLAAASRFAGRCGETLLGIAHVICQ
jgi:hypothetical protein